MKFSRLAIVPMAFALVAAAVVEAGAQPAPAPPPTTLWNFLGIPQGLNKLRANSVNRRGNFPGLEKKPPLKNIADPSNLFSDNPAIKKAAEIKTQEDMAKQKIKAIKYLASIGCGCYNKDGGITDALLAAMDDCTESVRLAAIEAIGDAAKGQQCEHCGQKSCCGEEISKKLAEIAYEKNDKGCWLEPSERVREAAIDALRACCPGQGPINAIEVAPPVMREGGVPSDAAPVPPPPASTMYGPMPEGFGEFEQATPLGANTRGTGYRLSDRPVTSLALRSMVSFSEKETIASAIQTFTAAPTEERLDRIAAANAPPSQPVAAAPVGVEPAPLFMTSPDSGDVMVWGPTRDSAGQAAASQDEQRALALPATHVRPVSAHGPQLPSFATVEFVDPVHGVVRVRHEGDVALPIGTRMTVHHSYFTGRAPLCQLEVISSSRGIAITRPADTSRLSKISRGDEAILPGN